MSRKKAGSKTIHIEYCRIYHEILKYEDVLDIELDKIYQTFLKVIAEQRRKRDMNKYPTQKDINLITSIIIDRLNGEK